jgi:hypothetical protein
MDNIVLTLRDPTLADPDQYDPRLARSGVIGAMEQALSHPIQVVELSGGGQYGTFGAGFLNGWSSTPTEDQR